MTTAITLLTPFDGLELEPPHVVMDCVLARALLKVTPVLRAHGVTKLHHMGAYAYRRVVKVGGPNRLSYHARGLALDVKGVTIEGKKHVVARNFVRGLPNGCDAEQALPLNRIHCAVRDLGLFDEIVSPDDDMNHHNHLHWALRPAAEESQGVTRNDAGTVR